MEADKYFGLMENQMEVLSKGRTRIISRYLNYSEVAMLFRHDLIELAYLNGTSSFTLPYHINIAEIRGTGMRAAQVLWPVPWTFQRLQTRVEKNGI